MISIELTSSDISKIEEILIKERKELAMKLAYDEKFHNETVATRGSICELDNILLRLSNH